MNSQLAQIIPVVGAAADAGMLYFAWKAAEYDPGAVDADERRRKAARYTQAVALCNYLSAATLRAIN